MIGAWRGTLRPDAEAWVAAAGAEARPRDALSGGPAAASLAAA